MVSFCRVGDVLPNIAQRGLSWCEAYRRDFSVGLDKLHRRDQARVSVLLVGDRMSGKSAFSKRFCQDSFDPEYVLGMLIMCIGLHADSPAHSH